jgi:hypothetical protein
MITKAFQSAGARPSLTRCLDLCRGRRCPAIPASCAICVPQVPAPANPIDARGTFAPPRRPRWLIRRGVQAAGRGRGAAGALPARPHRSCCPRPRASCSPDPGMPRPPPPDQPGPHPRQCHTDGDRTPADATSGEPARARCHVACAPPPGTGPQPALRSPGTRHRPGSSLSWIATTRQGAVAIHNDSKWPA